MTRDDGMVRQMAPGNRVFQNGTYIGEIKAVSLPTDEVMLSNSIAVSAHNLYPMWGSENCWDLDPSVPLDADSHVETVSRRGLEWVDFAGVVYEHVEGYTVKQYGDMGHDFATDMNADDCIKQIKKYAARFGSNAREGQDKLDLVKIAHYACLAYNKLEDK